MRASFAVMLLLLTQSSLLSEDFKITTKIKTPSITPSKIEDSGAAIDWQKLAKVKQSAPRRVLTTYYIGAGCTQCDVQRPITAQVKSELDLDWREVDVSRTGLPYEVRQRYGNQVPLTVLEDAGEPTARPAIVASRPAQFWKDWVASNPSTDRGGIFSPQVIGSVSMKAIGLKRAGASYQISIGGVDAVFKNKSPTITLEPPMSMSNGTIGIDITKVRIESDRLVLTAKGWPIEFALDLRP